MFFPSGNAEEFCDHVFRTFDMDKNGYIDFKVSYSIKLYKYIIFDIILYSLYIRMHLKKAQFPE